MGYQFRGIGHGILVGVKALCTNGLCWYQTFHICTIEFVILFCSLMATTQYSREKLTL